MVAHLIPVVWILVGGTSTGDLKYYFTGVNGYADGAMAEYPEVGTWPARLVNLLSDNNRDAFIGWFIALCVLASAAFTVWLLKADPSGSRRAGWFWVLFIAVSGPIVLSRLDLFPALAVAGFAALLFARSRAAQRTATVLLALATMMKLWPGVLGAGLVGSGRRWSTWARILWFFGSLAVLCSVMALSAGPERLTSPLNYQSDRGLQIESLAATPVMIAASFASSASAQWSISYAASKSFEITGPGVSVMTTVATIGTAAVLVFAVGWALVRLFRDDWTPVRTLAFSVATVALIIASNKVFSPQYITWLAPLVAVAVVVSRRRIVTVLAVEVLVTALLTTLVYPVFYDWLLVVPGARGAVLALTARNVGVLVIAATALWWAVTATRGGSSRP